MNPDDWVAASRDYEKEAEQRQLHSEPAVEHPLADALALASSEEKSAAVPASPGVPKTPKKEKKEPMTDDPLNSSTSKHEDSNNDKLGADIDPLSGQMANDPLGALGGDDAFSDPLLAPVLEAEQKEKKKRDKASDFSILQPHIPRSEGKAFGFAGEADEGSGADAGETFVPWSARKSDILSRYTTSDHIQVTANFLPQEDVPKQASVKTFSSKQRSRLEQLEEPEVHETQQFLQMTQKEYTKHIESINEELREAWNNDERVKALKLAIQAAKLLGETTVLRFFPSQFVLLTEILDTFGNLVFTRLKNRASLSNSSLPSDFKASMVSEEAKETARNWFYKIASIRELLPRLYVEMALLPCYRFLSDTEFPKALVRLSSMIRGIGDPIIAVYARAFLARKSHDVAPEESDFLLNTFFDFLFSLRQLENEAFVKMYISDHVVDKVEYTSLMAPALEWLLQCISYKKPEAALSNVLKFYKKHAPGNGPILDAIISSFPPTEIVLHAMEMTKLIKECDPEIMPIHSLFASLGMHLVMSPPPKGQELTILNEVWKTVTKITDPVKYLMVADVFVEYPMKYMEIKDLNILLGDILRHVKVQSDAKSHNDRLQSLIGKILSRTTDTHSHIHVSDKEKEKESVEGGVPSLLMLDNFLPLLDIFQGEIRLEVHKSVMQAFSRFDGTVSDSFIINAMFDVGKTLHDGINALTFADEVKQISELISAFIRRVDFGQDYEAHLNFYVECRRVFANLERVKCELVQRVNGLCMQAHRVMRGKHTRKTAAFARACIAYCFITIPSIQAPLTRINLYRLSAEVALANQSLPQADALIKQAITDVAEVPPIIEEEKRIISTESELIDAISGMASLLLVVPGDPSQGALFLLKGFLNVIEAYQWDKRSNAKAVLYTKLISLFVALGQDKLLYHVPKVESNDSLYGGDRKYVKELKDLISRLVQQILDSLTQLVADGEDGSACPDAAVEKQATAAMSLFNTVISTAVLTPQTATLCFKLFKLAYNSEKVNSAYLRNTIDYVGYVGSLPHRGLARELHKKMEKL